MFSATKTISSCVHIIGPIKDKNQMGLNVIRRRLMCLALSLFLRTKEASLSLSSSTKYLGKGKICSLKFFLFPAHYFEKWLLNRITQTV